MKQIEIFDPAMCCSTGVCGTGVDPKLAQIAADVEALKNQGLTVKRYNLAQDLDAFAGNAVVKSLLASQGTDILPVTLVDGEVRKEREYPTMSEFREWMEGQKPPASIKRLSITSIKTKPNGGCCGGKGKGSSCC